MPFKRTWGVRRGFRKPQHVRVLRIALPLSDTTRGTLNAIHAKIDGTKEAVALLIKAIDPILLLEVKGKIKEVLGEQQEGQKKVNAIPYGKTTIHSELMVILADMEYIKQGIELIADSVQI